MAKKRKQILKRMFDIKPIRQNGYLDMDRINKLEKVARIKTGNPPLYRKKASLKNNIKQGDGTINAALRPHQKFEKIYQGFPGRKARVIIHGQVVSDDSFFVSEVIPKNSNNEIFYSDAGYFKNLGSSKNAPENYESDLPLPQVNIENKYSNYESRKKYNSFRTSKSSSFLKISRDHYSSILRFAFALFLFTLCVPTAKFLQNALDVKDSITANASGALGNFALAKDNLIAGNFSEASQNFNQSQEILTSVNKDIKDIGGNFSELLRYIPGISKIATAEYIVSAGEDVALAGKKISNSLVLLEKIGNPLNSDNSVSLTDIFLTLKDGIASANENLKDANEKLSKSNVDNLPPDMRYKFTELKSKLPQAITSLQKFCDNSKIILDILGYNGPRKFLFLFENNQEMRATGGFIGSYGLLDISNGKVKNLFVDDIYNPDGQLSARIIPPEPIQKMSAAWTMHDANWFPDFPKSAEKVSWFYEKTGGPTVDGVIAITPDLIEKLLTITGPIDMPEYDMTIDSETFLEKTQYEVEVNYDKEENKPKKFLSDLMPKILEKSLDTQNASQMLKILKVFNSALNEKQLLIYAKNYEIEQMLSQQGWSGEILNTSKDYLSVINSNINGYKTDGIIDEMIEHHADIQSDGSIIDDVTITRKHNGGNEKYDWWNKVNGDYIRVYVPEKSELLEASGQTREFVSPPLDYQTLGFKKDPQVEQEEQGMKVDDATGTRMYSENHKTVFANWIYVSPGETVVLKYKYKLPFKLVFDDLHHPVDSFSTLYQKQSGSKGSSLTSSISYAGNFNPIWSFPNDLGTENNDMTLNTKLDTDKFIGIAFQKKQ
jgi:hypothetical protein